MKAQEIIKLIRSSDDEHSTRLIEDIFKFGFVMGMKKGYTNISMTIRNEVPVSDADEAKLIWLKNFL